MLPRNARAAPFAASQAAVTQLAAATAAATPVDYGDPKSWLCLPGRNDACSAPLTSTVIEPDGTRRRGTYVPDRNAPVDCFYVYPTASLEPTGNADMTASPELQRTALEQFARFGTKCRLYAPIYRQVTLAVLRGRATSYDEVTPYDDVLDAWNLYLKRYNHGRGVVLIGHSQGSNILVKLIASQIDGKPEEDRLISAIVPGSEVDVPAGGDVGGTFAHVPLCRSAPQTACVIAYSTYLANEPPGRDASFGASERPGDVDACVNPQALDGTAALEPALPTFGAVARALGTTLVENPGKLTAACETNGGRAYLAVRVDPSAPLLAAALEALAARHPAFGLHAFDVNIALGNLVDLVGTESASWLAAHRAR